MSKLFYSFVFIYSLFGFKLNLVESWGRIRPDDFLAVILGCLAVHQLLTNKLARVSRALIVFFVFILWSCLSVFYNFFVGRIELISGLLFALRHLEYSFYAYLGYMLAKSNFNFRRWICLYLIYSSILVVGQFLGVIGGVTSFSFNRAIANTGGPWELALLAAFMCLYFLEYKAFVWAAASFLLLVFTQSRVTIVALVVVFLGLYLRIFFRNILNSARRFSFVFLSALALCFVFVIGTFSFSSSSDGVLSRFEQALDSGTMDVIKSIVSNSTAVKTSADYRDMTYGDAVDEFSQADGDVSAYIRFNRWATLIKSSLGSLDSAVFGLGPSFAGFAVDGNFVRLLIEVGLIGFILYISFLFILYRSVDDRLLRGYLLVLVLSSIFIDALVTHKAMLLFWVFYGKYLHQVKIGRDSESLRNSELIKIS
ncbi:hypothetical protein [Stenotrophomonas sp. MMGLT7]|uniref:hypothetical protein n=1 Tax=Stenotrophomonas sp. MMGLT7 TaxID=2901227 RepID=UPI001E644D85|nr:hypothetical protein [Stenotrophomonas sp. MMGLT7]MCD7099308.1 hypothetical protein [Stenotrophomonas sp. MMGLT7]